MLNFFLSHASADAPLALYIRNTFEGNITGIEIFCSSDPTDLPPGTRWPQAIQWPSMNRIRPNEPLKLARGCKHGATPRWMWQAYMRNRCGAYGVRRHHRSLRGFP